MRHVEVAIIGAGSAGLAAYSRATDHTDSVVLIEGGEYGTTCALTGCMPSKLLIAAADSAQAVADAGAFGVEVSDYTVNGQAVMRRVQRLRDHFVGYVLESVDNIPDDMRLRGQASFIDEGTLRVGDETIKADRIVIATGSSPVMPKAFAAGASRVISSDSVFDLETVPGSLAVIGGGVIGLELGQAFSRLGTKVTLFDTQPQLGPATDPEISEYVTRHFSQQFRCVLNASVQEAQASEDGVMVRYQPDDGEARSESFEYLLVAVGRRSNLKALQLENTGLELDEQGTPRFDPCTLQCGDSPIFIAGDVNGLRPLLHEAADEGKIAGANAGRFPDIRAQPRRAPLQIVFSHPQIALAGKSHAELKGEDIAVGEVSFENQGRSVVINQNHGIARLYGDQYSGRLLGAELVGPAAEHLGHLLAWCIQQDLTVQQMIDLPFYHPVIEEGLRSALKRLRANLNMGRGPRNDCIDCGPGG